MYQCNTVAALPQPRVLVSDAMIADDRARKIAERNGVPAAPVREAARSAIAFGGTHLDGIRAANTAAYGIAVLTGRA